MVSTYENGTLELDLHQKRQLIEVLLAYDNVQVYDFQARADWICDLDNYIDTRHYSGAINDAMAEAMGRRRKSRHRRRPD